jgi:ABC-type branched-subunit amino acid transport system permease subunit
VVDLRSPFELPDFIPNMIWFCFDAEIGTRGEEQMAQIESVSELATFYGGRTLLAAKKDLEVTKYRALIMGPLLLLIVLFGRGGIVGLLGRLRRG